ncbi:MAG: hypothetical protein WC834_08120 [Eubacteriales bacterium]
MVRYKIRKKKGADSMSTLVLEKPEKKILTQCKKEQFKKIVGKYSSKIDLNKVRSEWKNEKN